MDELQSAVIDFSSRNTSGRIIVEYIWLGGNLLDIRSKCMTLPEDQDLNDLPEWNFDGSSTNQASGHDSEVIIRPRRIFPDPFRLGKHILVWCDTYYPNGERTDSNFRIFADQVFKKCAGEVPWFGIEQEYILYRKNVNWPLGFPEGGFPKPQGPYYCGVGSDVIVGRGIMDAHLRACLHCGIKISGTNAEVMPGQWEFQVGPCEGITSGDEMWMARYLLLRVAELFGVTISFDPKPVVSDDWNGSGCHTNYSTTGTRNDGGMQVIHDHMKKLEAAHPNYIKITGVGNEKRMSGRCETSDINTFSFGVANRGASIRIPRTTEKQQKGYYEDRRPASNMDPYVITAAIADITLLESEFFPTIVSSYQKYISTLRR